MPGERIEDPSLWAWTRRCGGRAGSSPAAGSSFRLPYTSDDLVAVGMDSTGMTLVVALADRVEVWSLDDHTRQDQLSIAGRVTGLRVAESADVVELRMAADEPATKPR